YATSNGSATAPNDYHPVSGTLHFSDGQKTRTFAIPIVDDTRHEPAERFTVRLSDPGGGAALGVPTSAQVTIRASD
ncbi:MAG TPA: Calx-beta domain-containing protein, partial [Actinomycetota bacterium]|nr:Calx-beta domain-containing protein [Actinomycetota bacterium]